MRMRKKKHGEERIAACASLLIPKSEGVTLDPVSCFSTSRPLWLEIGCGKGAFACGTAAVHPEINLLAMEKVSDVACIALEKAMACADERPGDNLRFYIGDARELSTLLPPHSVSCICLNFSDPWPKSGYYKRRLTYRAFLQIYRRLLVPGGEVRFKTDNDDLFSFSLEEFAAERLEIVWQTDDLHTSPYAEGNIMTEYEQNFTSAGKNIHAALIRFPD